MEDLERPRRQRPARLIAWMLAASALACLAEPVSITPRWVASYPSASNGAPSESTAVALNADSLMVAVVPSGANATNPALRRGNIAVTARMIGHDPVSRLGFFEVKAPQSPKPTEWQDDAGNSVGTNLQALTQGGMMKCLATGWVKQVGGKILPLALLRVNFDQAVPPPGTPLLDDSGRIVAIVFQSAGNGNTGYAIPAEAVHRVRRDICNGGHLIRGWLGLSLRAETQSPQIVRVLPDSPAAAAGIRPSDILLSVGSRPISDYADAANAFFYLIPGQPVRVKVLRGVDPLEFTLTPTRPRAE
jgi:membrane-associated protease RseP (regulator of RpoE activity)